MVTAGRSARASDLLLKLLGQLSYKVFRERSVTLSLKETGGYTVHAKPALVKHAPKLGLPFKLC